MIISAIVDFLLAPYPYNFRDVGKHSLTINMAVALTSQKICEV